MRTNVEKYNYHKVILDKQVQEYLDSLYPKGLPEKIFKVGRLKMTFENTTGLSYTTGFWKEDKPTRKDVLAISQYVFDANIENVYVSYEGRASYGRYTGAEKLSKILEKETMSFLSSKLEEKQSEMIELYTVKDGDISCTYCGKAHPEKNSIKSTVINFKMYGHAGKENLYCGGQCALHDQYAHEG